MQLLVILISWLSLIGPGNEGPIGERHDFHLTYGRIAVEDGTVMAQIRFFRDDLEVALRQYSDDASFRLSVDPQSDSLVLSYVDLHFDVTTASDRLRPTIVASGEDIEGAETVWWYVFDYGSSGSDLRALHLSNRLLFEAFGDQKNIVKIQHFPSRKEATYYLTEGDDSFRFEWE